MKTTYRIEKSNPACELQAAFDVSKDSLDMRVELPGAAAGGTAVTRVLEDHFANRGSLIRARLSALQALGREQGCQGGVRVICESTGGYEQKLLQLARQQGCRTSYANGEAVNKAKVIDHGDRGKSDQQDPAVMLTLARMDKLKTHRVLPPLYRQLRLLGRMYAEEDQGYRELRCKVHYALRCLFLDYSKPKDFIFSRSGEALVQAFAANPYTIAAKGFGGFCKAMSKVQPRIKKETLAQLWNDASSSVLHQMPPGEIDLLQEQLLHVWECYRRADQRRQALRERMQRHYLDLVAAGEALPKPDTAFLSTFCLSRIVGESGPLTDFGSIRAILKYAGLNLCRRQSGRYEGRIKISRKGSAPLRHALGVAALDAVRRHRCFGSYFHDPTRAHKPGTIRMTAVMRKILGTVWVLGTKRLAFNQERLATCEAAYRQAA